MYEISELKRTIFKIVKLIILLVLIHSCADKSKSVQVSDQRVKTDSASIWIEQAKNKDLPPQRQLQLLKKAYLTIRDNEDSLKTKYLSQISLAYLNMGDSLRFREANRETKDLANKINDSSIQAEAHWDLATFFKRNSVEDSAYYHYAKAQKIYSNLKNDFYTGRMLYNMAVVQLDVKDYTGSEITTIRAIEFLKPLNKYRQLYLCYNNLGIAANNLTEYDKAIEYHKTALEYLQKLEGGNGLQLGTQNNIGVVYQEQGRHALAIPYFRDVLNQDSLFQKDPRLYARALNNLAYNQFKIGNLRDVEDQLKRGLHIRDSIGDNYGRAVSHYYLAEYYLSQNDSLNAMQEAEMAKSYSEKSSNYDCLLQTLNLMSVLDPKKAVVHSQEYIKLNDSLQQEERKLRNKFARIRFETNETKAQNVLLARQKQLWIGIATILLLLALATYMVVDQRAKNQKLRFQREQQASNEKIFNLLLSEGQKVEAAKKMEQKRISEELHDGVQGRIQGVRMVLLGLNKRVTPEAITERAGAIKELKDIQEEVRAISHELSHSAYQKIHNFIRSIKDLLNGLEASAGLQHTFQYDEGANWDGLSGDIKINLYRMVQESLQNAVKHAQAKTVSLEFHIDEDNILRVSISDDGKGFQVKRGKKGIGLRNIASRAEKLKGSWDIQSSVGKGTKVVLTIPVRKYDNPDEMEGSPRALQEV